MAPEPTAPEPAIRRATPADLSHLLVLAAEFCHAEGHRFVAARVSAGFEPLLSDDAIGVVWLIDDDGYAVITWAWSIEIGGREVVLDELYVRTRRQGRGSAALTVIEDHCRRHGARRILLETERPNAAARRLYARHGFVPDDSIWMSKELI